MIVSIEYMLYMNGPVISSLLNPFKRLEVEDIAADSPPAHYAPVCRKRLSHVENS
jgi:hypothetical protein